MKGKIIMDTKRKNELTEIAREIRVGIIDPYFITADFPAESKLIADAREINNYKSFWCAEKVKNAMLEFELKHHRKPCVAMMGLAFKPNIDDLRESPAKYITTKVMQSCNNTKLVHYIQIYFYFPQKLVHTLPKIS